ncbi:MAG TPA: arylesterase [Candidatus Kapabacteria bacterium]|nr:arylesterase [Candidatus Kapabacteria bacterium]
MIRIIYQVAVLAALLVSSLCATEPKSIVVLGDSIAAGYGLDPEEAFPALLQEKVEKQGLNYKVVNAGQSGDTTAGGLRRIGWLLRQPVDVLLLELGGNDGLRGIDPTETAKNLQGIIDKVRDKNPDTQIVIAGMQMPENMGKEYTARFREVFSKVAQDNRATLIPFLLEGVGGKSELNQADRIHPTAEGHRIIAATIWKVLQPVLTNTGSIRESASR